MDDARANRQLVEEMLKQQQQQQSGQQDPGDHKEEKTRITGKIKHRIITAGRAGISKTRNNPVLTVNRGNKTAGTGRKI